MWTGTEEHFERAIHPAAVGLLKNEGREIAFESLGPLKKLLRKKGGER